MPDEIELKFTLQPGELRRVLAQPWLETLAEAPVTHQTIISTYYDTHKCLLRDKGISLRVRRIGNKRYQTIKASESSALFARKEWEMEISGDSPDYARMQDTALQPLLNKTLQRMLKPVFETRVRREAVLIQTNDGEVEVAVDRGKIKCGEASRPISEVELELKAGNPRAVYKTAARLARNLPLRYGEKTKPERGYALLKGRYDKPTRSEPIILERLADAASTFQVIGLSCLLQVARNEAVVCRGDREGIHQMRVGLRRLRAAIAIFKNMLQDHQSKAIKVELKWLTEQLAPARDYDVFLEQSDEEQNSRPPRAQAEAFRHILLQKRTAGFAKAKNAVSSERYRRLILRTALWLADGNWCRNQDGAMRRTRPAKALARKILNTRTRKIVKKINRVEKLDALHQHKLRIAIKKLRYATEFFDSLFERDQKGRKAFKKALEKLQTAMGTLNDIRVHERLAHTAVHEQAGAIGRTAALAVDVLEGQDRKKIGPLLKVTKRAGSHLAKLEPSWN